MRAELKVVEGKHQGAVIPINRKKFLVGREEDCHLRPNSDLVSRHHCVFSIDDYSVRLRDLGSTNGTLVNNTRLNGQVELKDGDKIRIGKLLFQVVIRNNVPAVAASTSGSPVSAPQFPIESNTLHSMNPVGNLTAEFSLSESGMIKIANEAGNQTGVFGGDTTLIPPGDARQNPLPLSVPTPLPPTVGVDPNFALPSPVASQSTMEIPVAQVPPPPAQVPPPPAGIAPPPDATGQKPSAADLIRQYMQKRVQ